MNNASKFYTIDEIFIISKNLEQKYPQAFDVLNKCWVSPYVWISELYNPYLDEFQADDFSNIWRHCVLSWFIAEKITNLLLDKKIIDINLKDKIVIWAILHDTNKRYEIMRRKASWNIANHKIFSNNSYDETLYFIKNTWVWDKFIELISDVSKITSHKIVEKFLKYQNWEVIFNNEFSLFEYIINLADNMSANYFENWIEINHIVDYENRVNSSDFKNRNWFIWKEWVVFFENWYETLIDISQNTKDWIVISYYEWQKIFIEQIVNQILEFIDIDTVLWEYEDNVKYLLKVINS